MRKLCLLIVLFTVSACQSKQVIVPAVVHNVSTTEEVVVEKAHLPIIGEVEPIYFLPMKSPFAARIDTGATTSSLDCQDVEYFERDGENGLRLNLKTVRQARNMFLKRKSNVHLRLSVPEKTKAAKPLKWMLKWAEKCSAPYFP